MSDPLSTHPTGLEQALLKMVETNSKGDEMTNDAGCALVDKEKTLLTCGESGRRTTTLWAQLQGDSLLLINQLVAICHSCGFTPIIWQDPPFGCTTKTWDQLPAAHPWCDACCCALNTAKKTVMLTQNLDHILFGSFKVLLATMWKAREILNTPKAYVETLMLTIPGKQSLSDATSHSFQTTFPVLMHSNYLPSTQDPCPIPPAYQSAHRTNHFSCNVDPGAPQLTPKVDPVVGLTCRPDYLLGPLRLVADYFGPFVLLDLFGGSGIHAMVAALHGISVISVDIAAERSTLSENLRHAYEQVAAWNVPASCPPWYVVGDAPDTNPLLLETMAVIQEADEGKGGTEETEAHLATHASMLGASEAVMAGLATGCMQ